MKRIVILLLMAAMVSCGSVILPIAEDQDAGGDGSDSGSDADSDVDADTDTDTDVDAGADSDVDADTDTDTDADTDGDTDSDTGTEVENCDVDEDAHLAEGECGGDDCDDADATVYMGAPDPTCDGVDRNCDNCDSCGGYCW